MPRPTPPGLTRRALLRAGAAAGALAAASPFEALAAAAGAGGHEDAAGAGYGALRPVRDDSTRLPLLELPEGFGYLSFGWRGDALDDGTPTPRAHDGMAALRHSRGVVALVRNHEIGAGAPFGSGTPLYDPGAGGGTTTLHFDTRRARLRAAFASLSGTVRNCAGGPTPWHSWISCEETTVGPGDGPFREEHGFCFEVPVHGRASARPLRAMGRFAHEAVAFTPNGRMAILTEDAGAAGLYRFLPHRRENLEAGGVLQMLRVRGAPRSRLDRGQTPGAALPIDWVDIPEPAPPGRARDVARNRVHEQGFAQGGARFRRLEGAWWSGRFFYFASTTGGDAGLGQIWELDPEYDRLRLVFESTDRALLEMPDNLSVSPRGGITLCEDSRSVPDRIHALSPDGRIEEFARGAVQLTGERGFFGDFRSSELAGACWSPRGRWLFFNVQRPGLTVAVRGPWRRGAL